MKFWSTNEEHVFEERLGMLEVLMGRRPDRGQEQLAVADVERFRRERSDKQEPTKRKVKG